MDTFPQDSPKNQPYQDSHFRRFTSKLLLLVLIQTSQKSQQFSGFYFLMVTSKKHFTSIYREIHTFLEAFSRIPEKSKNSTISRFNLILELFEKIAPYRNTLPTWNPLCSIYPSNPAASPFFFTLLREGSVKALQATSRLPSSSYNDTRMLRMTW